VSDDLDRLLKESLKSAGDGFDKLQDPRRRAEARQEFLRRAEKRRWAFPFMVAVAAAGVAALVAFGVYVVVDAPGTERIPKTDVAGPDDPYTSFPIGGDPVDIGIRDNGLWVADAANGRLIHMDPATGDELATVDLGGSPRALAIGTGSVWVGDPGSGLLYQIDKTTDELIGDPIEIGDPAPSMSISVGLHGVWVVSGGELSMVDLETSTVTPIDSVSRPLDAAANLGSVWVLDAEVGLVQLDPQTGAVIGQPIPVQGETGDVYAGAGAIWVADRQDDTIVSIDPDTGRTLFIKKVRGTYLSLAFGSDVVWALSRAGTTSGYLTPLDPATGDALTEPLTLEGDPIQVATGADAVWVAFRGDNAVARVEPVDVLQGGASTPGP
jgi:streptogramin lyase